MILALGMLDFARAGHVMEGRRPQDLKGMTSDSPRQDPGTGKRQMARSSIRPPPGGPGGGCPWLCKCSSRQGPRALAKPVAPSEGNWDIGYRGLDSGR